MVNKVLIVSDDAGARDSLASALSGAGFEVAAVSSTEEALESWGGMLPDAFVLDSSAKVLADWLLRSVVIPIVFFSERVDKELEEQAQRVGAVIVPKNDVEGLIAALRSMPDPN